MTNLVGAPIADAQPQAADRDLYWRIGTFLFEQGLPATPAYYLLAHTYTLRGDAGVIAAVDAAIADGTPLAREAADAILAAAGLGAPGLTPVHFERIAGETEARVDRVAGLVERSHDDAGSFGDALEANAAGLSAGAIESPVAAALLDLTGAMIASTRNAAVRLRRTADEMDMLRVELAAARADAETDVLTDLPNRRAFNRRFEDARRAAADTGGVLTVALIDIDRFKEVNDAHGHDVGDRVLQLFARTLREACAPHVVSRRGGEEFALLFANTGIDDAFTVLDRARETMAARSLRVAETRRALGVLTFSGGIATFDGTEGCAAMLRRADDLLYAAKQAGRNRVAV